MKDISTKRPEDRKSLHGRLAEFRQALEEEIQKIEKNGQSSTTLTGGKRITSQNGEFWYRFYVEYAPVIPADTPCKLIILKEEYNVTVVSFEENYIVLSSSKELPENIAKARLDNGSTVLMERLIKCIEDNAEKKNPAGQRMLPETGNVIAQSIHEYEDKELKLDPKNTANQTNAVKSSLTNDITFIWGPPGTGKTSVIGQIINNLYRSNRSCLIVSHTNVAVDGAVENAAKLIDKDGPIYPVLRLGLPTKDLPEHVKMQSHVAAINSDLTAQKLTLENAQNDLRKRSQKISPIITKSEWVQTNQLSVASGQLAQIKHLQKKMDGLVAECARLESSMADERTKNPDYRNYERVRKNLEAKEREFADVQTTLENITHRLEELPFEIERFESEIRKHNRYSELREKESKLMTAPFLQGELVKINGRKTAIQSSIAHYEAELAAAKQTVMEYEKKSSVAKFFSGKAGYTQAINTIEQVNAKLVTAQDELQQQVRLGNEYQTQLNDLLFLQAQIRDVLPSETKQYWSNLKTNAIKLQDNLQKQLSDIKVKEHRLRTDLPNAQREAARIKDIFVKINALEGQLKETAGKRVDAQTRIYSLNASVAEILYAEYQTCTLFGFTTEEFESEKLSSMLLSLLATSKRELSNIDIPALKKEQAEIKNQLIEIHNQLIEIEKKMQEAERLAIMQAKVIGATLTKTYISDILRERSFDTVILDEASMASIPALWCASYLAEKNIVIVGDFLQLPPIVMADTPIAKKWLGQDIFFHSGVQEQARTAHKEGHAYPACFAALTDQFRMEQKIADIANMYYGEYGSLRSQDSSPFRKETRQKFYDWYAGDITKPCIQLIDTQNLHAWVTSVSQGKSHSRLNMFSATVCVDLAFKLLENITSGKVCPDPKDKPPYVLIVAPYKPHVVYLNKLIKLEYERRGLNPNLNYITVGTIHSFQGNEADIVIFDLVIDEPHWKCNLFLSPGPDDKFKEADENMRKMFNVAVTRAKFKLFVVGDFDFCCKHAKNNALSELLLKLLDDYKLKREDAKELLPEIMFSRLNEYRTGESLAHKRIACTESSFYDFFMEDLRTFSKCMVIYSAFIAQDRLAKLLPAFHDAIKLGKRIVVITKALNDRKKSEVATYRACEEELSKIGVTVVHKAGMHEKLVFIDDDILWMGSLNVLSFSGNTGETMDRFQDKDMVADHRKLCNFDEFVNLTENMHILHCPICGGELLVKEGGEGGIYWSCENGDYTRNPNQQYPEDGVLRCVCGSPYVYNMKNSPRWVCPTCGKFCYIREGDLRLEKMAALIPTKKERKIVDKYFSDKRKEREKKSPPKAKTTAKKSSVSKKKENEDSDQIKLF